MLTTVSALFRQRPPHLGLCVGVPASSNMGGPGRSGRLQPPPQHCHLGFKRTILASFREVYVRFFKKHCIKINVRHFIIFRKIVLTKYTKKYLKAKGLLKMKKKLKNA
jgi:hypothetical protein